MKKRKGQKGQLELGKGLSLPENAVTQTLAFLARRGAGKTYAAMRLCEQMLGRDAQVIIVDPVGVWWGLRLNQTGDGPSDIKIPVLGGLRNDIPLSAEGGALVAEALIEHGASAVLDVSLLSKRKMRQFLTDFGERFLLLKKRRRSPVHLFLEEAQEVVPQRVVKGGERLLGAFESIIKLGRNFGIGASLISQRPQAVNKDVLNQAELLVVLQLTGPHERRAIRSWIQEQGADGAELEARLPKLQTGQAIVWSPAWLQIYKEVRILKKTSFDASSTPTLEDLVDAPKALEPLDLFALKASIEKLSADTVKKDRPQHKGHKADAALLARLRAAEQRITELEGALEAEQRKHAGWVAALEQLLAEAKDPSIEDAPAPKAEETKARGRALQRPARRGPSRSKKSGVLSINGLSKGAPSALLGQLVRWHPQRLTKQQLALQSGYSSKSSTFSNALTALRKGAWLDEQGPGLGATKTALQQANGVVSRPLGSLVEAWAEKLPGGAPRALFDVLTEAHPDWLSREALAKRAGYSSKSSTFANALTKLRGCGLIEEQGKKLKVAGALYLETQK